MVQFPVSVDNKYTVLRNCFGSTKLVVTRVDLLISIMPHGAHFPCIHISQYGYIVFSFILISLENWNNSAICEFLTIWKRGMALTTFTWTFAYDSLRAININ